jgi:hypothetical protein
MTNPQTSMMSPINFGFILDKTPNTNYLVQKVDIPGLQLGIAQSPSPGLVRIINPGNIEYGDLNITFKVGEDMSDYLEIFNWMTELGHPDSLAQYSRSFYDATVLIMDSAKRPKISVRFTDCIPVGLSPVSLDSTLEGVQYLNATATFRFQRFFYTVT